MTIRELFDLLERRVLVDGADPDNTVDLAFTVSATAASGGVRVDLWEVGDGRAPIASALLDAGQLATARLDLWHRLEPR